MRYAAQPQSLSLLLGKCLYNVIILTAHQGALSTFVSWGMFTTMSGLSTKFK